MSYESHAINEFELVPEYKDVKDSVLAILAEIEKEGHSGGSMGVFSGMFNNWMKDPKELKDNELFSPIWNIVKDLDPEYRNRVLFVTSKVMIFKPLSPLTGEDDEWVIHDYDGDMYAQNKRMGSVFKRKDGTAYWIAGRIFYEPYSTYTGFSGYTSRDSRVEITFPFDTNIEPERVYYVDRERTSIIEADPKEWLKQARSKFLKGIDPLTDKIDPIRYFIEDKDIESFMSLYSLLKDLLGKKDKDQIKYFFSDLFYYMPRSGTYQASLEIEAGEKLPEISENIKSMVVYNKWADHNCSDTHTTQEQKNKRVVNVTLTNHSFVGNLSRLLEVRHPDNYEIEIIKIFKPSKHYQDFVESNKVHITFTNPDHLHEKYFFDGLDNVEGNPFTYLYNKCKEKDLEYKGPKS